MNHAGEDAMGARGASKSPELCCCGACGKELTVATNDEECPESMYWHRKHTIFIFGGVCCQ